MKRTGERAREIRALNRTLRTVLDELQPPEDLTVNEWADRYRVLPGSSAEAGLWRTSRTPYLEEPMRAFTDPKVESIVMAAASQVGKSEFELNVIGYIIDQEPGNILYVHPNLDDAKRFSRQRVSPMIRAAKRLKAKVRDPKSVRSGDTVLQKLFPGGSLTLVGSNSPSALASIPCRYIIGDECDRFAPSAGREGDPWELARARQRTFYNRKSVEVSTPTIKGASHIEEAFLGGTQERWRHKCPDCGAFFEIRFSDIRFEHEKVPGGRRQKYRLTGPVMWCCPGCGSLHEEREMRQSEQKWVADDPAAYEERHTRSFWLNAFASPWVPWDAIVLKFLDAKNDPDALQVVYNTLFGEVWEDRGTLDDEEQLLLRREDYGTLPDGRPVDVPDGVLALTCGVDVQDNRLEYEVVGHGLHKETWGIQKGYIMTAPDREETWAALDAVLDHPFLRRDGSALTVGCTAVDSGGHFTQEVYLQCWRRQAKRVFAIKGQGGDGIPLIRPAKQVPLRDNNRVRVWLYSLGVDAGKAAIMGALKVGEPGPKYCHFPLAADKLYDRNFFNGLLSEKLELVNTGRGQAWRWKKQPGHNRNEALDCRNYANAARLIWNPDLDAIDRRMKGQLNASGPPQPKRRKTAGSRYVDGADW